MIIVTNPQPTNNIVSINEKAERKRFKRMAIMFKILLPEDLNNKFNSVLKDKSEIELYMIRANWLNLISYEKNKQRLSDWLEGIVAAKETDKQFSLRISRS